MLNEDELVRFNAALPQLELCLDANDVCSYLVSKSALTSDEADEIKSHVKIIFFFFNSFFLCNLQSIFVLFLGNQKS